MDITQIRQLLNVEAYNEKTTAVKLVETHVSWVLLTDQFAYKIKKPVKFSFLDFSTLEKRRYYCERELQLNARLTSDMYLAVAPIIYENEQYYIGKEGEVIDYALKMKRLDSARQMHDLLQLNKVTPGDIQKLAYQIADFHQRAELITNPVNITELQHNFADILRIRDFLTAHLKKETLHILEAAVEKATRFLRKHEARLKERGAAGFIIDGHGDLHAGNIFLLEEPVIFDCLEFNDNFRRLDMLDEVAFLCLDLDYYNRPDLEQDFLAHYLAKMPCLRDEEDREIFNYYKLYRANVRLKVTFLKAKQQVSTSAAFQEEFDVARRYFELFEQYLELLN
ncbi:MAG: hypothetical protein ACK4TA_23160 [Saprospiraceae bacterium]